MIQGSKATSLVDNQAFVASQEQLGVNFPETVIAVRESALQPFHAGDLISLWSERHQMEMVGCD